MTIPYEKQAQETEEFAELTTRTLRLLCKSTPTFKAEARFSKGQWRATVQPAGKVAIPLTIGGQKVLKLHVSYECTVSSAHDYMLIESSKFNLLNASGGEPLIRLEYNRNPESETPSAHLHVHAHRDAWTYAMTRPGASSPRRAVSRPSRNRVPQLSDIHIPVGGPRLRPTLEDFIQMLICDLGVDHEENALTQLARQRTEWRRVQVRAVVNSMQDEAAEVLREHGWSVTPPDDHVSTDTQLPNWLKQY